MSQKKKNYKKRILKQFYFSKTLSCADLCERLDKSLPLITKLVNELVEEGRIVESGFAPSTGGRRPLCYSLKSDIYYIVAISMDQLVTKISLVDMENNFVGTVQKYDLVLKDNPDALYHLRENIIEFLEKVGDYREKVVGIGIGMPGFIDTKKCINYSFLQSPDGSSITDYISKKIDLPVFIDNDSSLIALAELRFGSAKEHKNIMVVNMGWGVGLGMILNGILYRGDNGFAGEFSHIPVFNNNKLCSCGKHGCLETETSLLVLIQKAKQGLESGRLSLLKNYALNDVEEANNAIIKTALAGDQFAVELLSEVGFKIGRGVAILIHLLNPQLIVMSGRGSAAGKIWQAPIQQALNEYCIPRLAHNTQVVVSELGYKAELIGAAALVMENFENIHTLKTEVEESEEIN